MQAFADGFSQNYSEIDVTAKSILNSLTDSIASNIEPLVNAGMQITGDIAKFIVDNLDTIIDAELQLIQALCDTLLNGDNLEKLLDAGIQILWAIVNAIVDNLDTIVDIAIQIIEFLTIELLKPENLEKLLQAGADILLKLIEAIIDNLDELLLAGEEIVKFLVEDLLTTENAHKLLNSGAELLGKVINGLCQIGGKLVGWAVMIFDELDRESQQIDWNSIGWEMLEGILSGFFDMDFKLADYFDDFKENWVSGFKEIFGIHSPSKVMQDEVGKFIALGIGEGFADNMKTATEQATKAIENMTADFPKYGEQSAKQFLDNLSGNLKQVSVKVSEYLNIALDFAEKWGISISENGKNSAKQFLDNTHNFMKQLPHLVTNICNDALKNVINWGISLYENGLTLTQNLVNGIIDIVDIFRDEIADNSS